MKIGEVWKYRYEKAIHCVKIVRIYEECVEGNDEWVLFSYCDNNGELGPDEYQHGDTLPRYLFVKQYGKVYK